MADESLNYSERTITSDQLIAEAYAAIERFGMREEPPPPTGAPVSVQAAPKSAASRPAASSAASYVPSLSQQAKAKPTAGPKVIPTGAPYQQPARESRSSSPFQPPPPSGAGHTQVSRPIAPSRQAMTTGPASGAPAPPRPIAPASASPQPANQRSAQPVPKKKSNGWVTAFIWFLIIMFAFFVLPALGLFD